MMLLLLLLVAVVALVAMLLLALDDGKKPDYVMMQYTLCLMRVLLPNSSGGDAVYRQQHCHYCG
jgi:hypothetical protein